MADGSGGTLVVDPPASSDAAETLAQGPLSGARYREAIAEGFNKGILDFSISKSVSLSDDGTITLSYPTQIVSQHHAVTLTNVNDVLAGSGIIGDSFLALVNDADGVIDANETQNALIINTSRFAMNNEGILEATGAGWLAIDHTSVANGSAGIVRASGVGSRIDLDSATIVSGTVLVDEGSVIDTINGGASAIAGASITNVGTIAASYGNLTLAGAVTNSGVLSAANGSYLKITGAVTGSGSATIASNGIIEFGTASNANVTFLDATGTLRLDADMIDSSKFTGKVLGFGGQDRIDLADIAFGPHTTLGYSKSRSGNGGVLTVEDGAHVATIALLGNYMATSFVLSTDGPRRDLGY